MSKPGQAPTQSAEDRPPPPRADLLTILALVGATAGWGVGATMTRLAVVEIAPLATACLRFGMGALLLGGLGVTGFGALFTIGLQWTGPTEGTLIQGTTPLMTLVLAALLAGEPIRRWQVAGGLMAFAGLGVLLLGGGTAAVGGGEDRLFGNLVLIGAGLCWAGYNVSVRLTARRLQLGESSAFALLAGTLLLVPFALWETPRGSLTTVGLSAWLAIAYLAVVSTCLAYVWWNHGIRKLGAGRAAMFSFVGPVAAMLSAIPLLGEWPTGGQMLGGALILSGLFAANRS